MQAGLLAHRDAQTFRPELSGLWELVKGACMLVFLRDHLLNLELPLLFRRWGALS